MKPLNVYSFHRNIAPYRFDNHNTLNLIQELERKYKVKRFDLDGSDGFVFNGVTINHGSILIFEDADTKAFKVYDFGDSPYLVEILKQSQYFTKAVLGQYNPHIWKEDSRVCSGVYPETIWDFGTLNHKAVTEYRINNTLSSKLYWRGSLYSQPDMGYGEYLGARKAIELLPELLGNSFHFGNHPVPFDTYIQEAINYKLTLSIGGGGGYPGAKCGDICFRDIEMFGLGIPVIRPKYVIEMADSLLPNYHYIAVDVDFDDTFKYLNHDLLASRIAETYQQVVKDTEFLEQIAINAKNWYRANVSSKSITNRILTSLDL
jgi:hypothetical protein